MTLQLREASDRAIAYRQAQVRDFDLVNCEFRDALDADGYNFDGTASAVGLGYDVHDDIGVFRETIEEGGFDKTLRDIAKARPDRVDPTRADVAMFVNHRHADVPMATTLARTLALSVTPHLRSRANLDVERPDVIIARSAVRRGEMRQMSIGFTINKGRDTWNKDYSERIIHEVNLSEVSIVRQGANPYTSASMRSFASLMQSITDCTATKAELRRAARVIQLRFADLFDNMIEDRLRDELKEMLGVGPDQFVSVCDHTDSLVIYCVYGGEDDDMYQLGYTADAEGNVTLSTDAPIVVQSVTTYVPEPPESDGSGRSVIEEIEERDRQDRERLERRRHAPV